MRCLYCGKELALLKRWTGGGEFCSDAHRQQYQEEYNQLALNRLLQAKPQQDAHKPKEDPKREEAAPPVSQPVPKPAPQPVSAVARIEAAAPVAIARVPEPEPEARPEAEPEAETQREEEAAPAELAGLFIELPVPVETAIHAVLLENGFALSLPIELPRCEYTPSEQALAIAGQTAVPAASRPVDSGSHIAERRLEVRDFVRATPMVSFNAPFGRPEFTETCEESMDILIFPHPPQPSPQLWNEDARAFAFGRELGALARVAFRTTGVEDKGDGPELMPVEAGEETLFGLAKADLPQPEFSPVSMAPAVEVAPAPVIAVRATPPAPQTEPQETEETKSEPGPATKPLPMTLHGLSAGRGKPVQVFHTGVTGDLEVQAPRSTALPLRPVMTLAPATAAAKTEERRERTVLVKAEPKKPAPQPSRQDTGRNGKGRTEKEEQKPVAVSIVQGAAQEPPVKGPEPETKLPEKKTVEPKASEPPSKPYTMPDLGLPKLTIESGGMPMPLKLGLAAAAVIVLGVVLFFALRGGGQTVVAKGPQVVPGAPLTAMDSSWITDWGAEAGVRREHEISILRPSLNLSDYRLEFDAQIETKAIGWVFRAKDGKNYYVAKLEIVTPGLEPVVDAVHFAVINGEAQARSQTPLPMKVRLDTMYKVRFDALGDHFTTWVQDQKVDDWTDASLKIGGVGLYNERGERMSLKGGFSAVPLEIRK